MKPSFTESRAPVIATCLVSAPFASLGAHAETALASSTLQMISRIARNTMGVSTELAANFPSDQLCVTRIGDGTSRSLEPTEGS